MRVDPLILLVEDNATNRTWTAALLRAAGYRVACAANGQEALDYLSRAEWPCLILLDLSMPVMDGREFRARQLRCPWLADIPVFLLSGEADLPQIAASLGVAGYFPKAVEPDELFEGIRAVTEGLRDTLLAD
jgi:CheY-like chemotaxis protein